jgi:hypothetical protein
MRQNFKFGRGFVVDKFTLFDPRYYDQLFDISNLPRVSVHRGTSGTSGNSGYIDDEDINPQFKMKGIKKFYHKGKYPRPRNN